MIAYISLFPFLLPLPSSSSSPFPPFLLPLSPLLLPHPLPSHIFQHFSYRPVKCVDFTVDGLGIVSGSDDTTVKVWDMATGITTAELRGHKVRNVYFIHYCILHLFSHPPKGLHQILINQYIQYKNGIIWVL